VERNRTCAYCDAVGQLTREHILPKFIHAREKRDTGEIYVSNILDRDGRHGTVQSELTIADVCAACNGGFLSDLDAYGSKLYDAYFDKAPRPGDRIVFHYEFHRLTRWLLKLAYNTGRMRKWPENSLKHIRNAAPYISGSQACRATLRLYVQLLAPSKLNIYERQRILDTQGVHMEELPHEFKRIGIFLQRDMDAGYLIGMNSYQFYVAFWHDSLTSVQLREAERKFLRQTLGSKRLLATDSQAVLHASSLSLMDVAKMNPVLRSNVARNAMWIETRKSRKQNSRTK
jgi:hypothetical protein